MKSRKQGIATLAKFCPPFIHESVSQVGLYVPIWKVILPNLQVEDWFIDSMDETDRFLRKRIISATQRIIWLEAPAAWA